MIFKLIDLVWIWKCKPFFEWCNIKYRYLCKYVYFCSTRIPNWNFFISQILMHSSHQILEINDYSS